MWFCALKQQSSVLADDEEYSHSQDEFVLVNDDCHLSGKCRERERLLLFLL